MIHWLKTEHSYFQESWDGSKPYEIRVNDRDYQLGDILILAEGTNDACAGRAIIARVTSVIQLAHALQSVPMPPEVVGLGLIKLGHIDSFQEQDFVLFEHTLTKVTSVEWTSSKRREKKENVVS